MLRPEAVIEIPQNREASVQGGWARPFAYRYAYARSVDSRAAGDPGQDYLSFRADDQSFLFALCDGVSQSFYGDLAARFLGQALLEWLESGLPASLDAAAIRTALNSYLQSLGGPAGELVQRQPLPEDIPALLRDVLEQKRAHGSESTFVCGRVDLPGAQFSQGRVVLAWMGDSRARLWGPTERHPVDLGGEFRTDERWSSRRGPVGGEPHVFASPLEEKGRRLVVRLLAYSDGLSSLDRIRHSPSDQVLQNLIQEAGESATSDDISLLEVWLGPSSARQVLGRDAPGGRP